MRKIQQEATKKAKTKGESMEAIKRLKKISHLVNPTKKQKTSYITVLYVRMKSRLGKNNFNSLIILLDSRARSSIVLGKNTKKYPKKNPDGHMEHPRP